MSTETKAREAIDRLATRIHNEDRKEGRSITFEDARGKARDIAVRYTRKKHNNSG